MSATDKLMVPGELPGLMREATDMEALMHAELARLRAALAEAEQRADAFGKETTLLTHKIITCGVAASHKDPGLSRRGVYAGAWDSPQAQAVRDLRDRADSALAAKEAAERERAEMEDCGESTSEDACGECLACLAVRHVDDCAKRAAAQSAASALKAEVERVTEERDEWRRRVGCRPECTLMCCDQDCDNSGVEDPDGRNAWDLLDGARASALRWYRADGTYEVLGSPEEVVERRKEAAKVLAAASALRERATDLLECFPDDVEWPEVLALRSLLAAAPPHEET